MTINTVDMQVLVPRVGEVGKVNRMTQGQQQTDQQIMNQLIHENLKRKESTVNSMLPTDSKKVQVDDENKKNGKKDKEDKKENEMDINIKEKQDEQDNKDGKYDSKTGRYFDIKV
ncbi:MAG: hypothetical protein PHI90_02020 [Clostridia bacterium]|nr:hypothetical protein [Clostridia bacterium]MDD4047599.1 hypothetical protein [Clostridia bacterium]